MRVVQAFTAEDREFEHFQKANWAVREKSLEANRIAALRQPMLTFCLKLLLVVVLGYGGHLVIGGHMTIGTLVAFTQYNGQLTAPIRASASCSTPPAAPSPPASASSKSSTPSPRSSRSPTPPRSPTSRATSATRTSASATATT